MEDDDVDTPTFEEREPLPYISVEGRRIRTAERKIEHFGKSLENAVDDTIRKRRLPAASKQSLLEAREEIAPSIIAIKEAVALSVSDPGLAAKVLGACLHAMHVSADIASRVDRILIPAHRSAQARASKESGDAERLAELMQAIRQAAEKANRPLAGSTE